MNTFNQATLIGLMAKNKLTKSLAYVTAVLGMTEQACDLRDEARRLADLTYDILVKIGADVPTPSKQAWIDSEAEAYENTIVIRNLLLAGDREGALTHLRNTMAPDVRREKLGLARPRTGQVPKQRRVLGRDYCDCPTLEQYLSGDVQQPLTCEACRTTLFPKTPKVVEGRGR